MSSLKNGFSFGSVAKDFFLIKTKTKTKPQGTCLHVPKVWEFWFPGSVSHDRTFWKQHCICVWNPSPPLFLTHFGFYFSVNIDLFCSDEEILTLRESVLVGRLSLPPGKRWTLCETLRPECSWLLLPRLPSLQDSGLTDHLLQSCGLLFHLKNSMA